MDKAKLKEIYLNEGIEGIRNQYKKTNSINTENAGMMITTNKMQDLKLIIEFGKSIANLESKGISGIRAIKVYYANKGIYL